MALSSKLVIHKAGGSLRISLPPEWIDEEGIYPKDVLHYIASGGMLLLYKLKITTTESEIDEALKDMKLLIMMEQRKKELSRTDKKTHL